MAKIPYPDPKRELLDRFSKAFTEDRGGTATSTNFLAIAIIVCAALIIVSQFVIADRSHRQFRETLQEMEYGKVGGEENYRLLREIQREQTQSYIRELEAERPDYVRQMKLKSESAATPSTVQYGTLTEREMEVVRRDAPILGNSGAALSIVEFSDFECPYCKDFHNEGIVRSILESTGSGANYLFKTMPGKKYENAAFLARAAKCATLETGTGSDFFATVDAIFAATGSTVEAAYSLAEASGMGREALKACTDSSEVAELTEKDIGQGVYLRIRSTPSLVLIDNATGKYAVLPGKTEKAAVEAEIEKLIKKTP